jgi:hypothetical protein
VIDGGAAARSTVANPRRVKKGAAFGQQPKGGRVSRPSFIVECGHQAGAHAAPPCSGVDDHGAEKEIGTSFASFSA